MMTSAYSEIIQRHCRALDPQPTSIDKRLVALEGIRAVLFDVYGTMIISASGDVGANVDAAKAEAMREACKAVQIDLACDDDTAFTAYVDMIREHHATARNNGIEFPEVDIVEVWREAIGGLVRAERASISGDVDWKRLAIEYEVRVNPTWPMPGLVDCLQALIAAEKALGIVSNAQFFTLELFPALVRSSVDALGFSPSLQYYSYRFGEAKPGVSLYEGVANALQQRGISPAETLYVGNDMLNDIRAAALIGFRTALFAGDARSLRMREDDSRVRGVKPDLIVTELADLLSCV